MHIRDVCSFILGISGLIFIIFGVAFGLSWKNLFQSLFDDDMKLSPKSKSYEMWKAPPIPMALDIYFFNWTNPEEFKESGKKPILQELGPYRFIEKLDKTKIVWNRNATVSFRKISNYYFDPEGSKGSLDDNITTLNILALSAASRAKDWGYLKRRAVAAGLYLYNQKIHVTKTADELLFTGYEDELINVAKEMPMFGEEKVEIPFDRFGWFYMRNSSDELLGHYNMYTGKDDLSNIGVMGEWNYQNRTSYFPEHCGMVNGSAGEFYPPNQVKNKSISFFSPDMCRSLTLDYEKEVVINQLTGYKYIGGARLVDNGTKYPDNWCFCNGECIPSGLLNVSSCRFGTPAFMSFPHYYGADPYYLDKVEGLSPSQDKHEFYMTLEPRTGLPLDVAARFQVNMLVQPIPDISLYEGVPYIFFPVLWFEQKVTIPNDISSELAFAFSLPKAGHIFASIITIIGILMLTIFVVNYYLRKRQRKVEQKNRNLYKNGIDEMKKGKYPEISPLMHENTAKVIKPNEKMYSDMKNGTNDNTKYKYLYPRINELTKESGDNKTTIIN